MPTELIWDEKHEDRAKSSPLCIGLPFKDEEPINESPWERMSHVPMERAVGATLHPSRKQYAVTPIPDGLAAAVAGSDAGPRWRASRLYTANNASKNGLLQETRLALLAYHRVGDRAAARRELLDGGLPQRSRATRKTIMRVISDRLDAWRPPAWAYADLVASAESGDAQDLSLLLLLHAARQDALLYDVVQQVAWSRWRDGITTISRVDVQRFLDDALPDHPEIDRWSLATREKLAGNLLTILRDYGLLHGQKGHATKRIVEPVVSPWAAGHLVRLLREEGIPDLEMLVHPDWRLWLLDADRVRTLVARINEEDRLG